MTLALPSLPLESDAVRLVKYHLQKQLNAPRVKILECQDATSVSAAKTFNDFISNIEPKNVAHIFIPVTDLYQPLSDIQAHGVRVNPRKGLKIRTNKCIVDENKEHLEIVHCVVALGQPQDWMSVTAEFEEHQYEDSFPVPEALRDGYHCFRISDDNEFVIFNQNQLRTLHIITCTGGRDLKPLPETPNICSLCRDKEADVWCTNCRVRLCKECSKESHSHNPVLENHDIIPIEKASMESCPFHPKNPVEHYCKICHVPVCMQCKLEGSHSKGEAARHELVPIREAYKESVAASEKAGRIYERRRNAIKNKIRDADNRLKDVAINAKNVEARIMKIAQEAILSLRTQAGERALLIKSLKDELARKSDELEHEYEFIQLQRELDDPISFIQAFATHCEIAETELREADDLPIDAYVQGDLAVVGTIEVEPRQVLEVAEGVRKRDLDYEERVRNTDASMTATTVSEDTQQSYTYTTASQTATTERTRHIHKTKLSSMAHRKLKKWGHGLSFQPFEGSAILKDEETARNLYLSMPFKASPETHLLFSTERDGRSLSRLHEAVDDVGITAVVVKRGVHVFGGFAAQKWRKDNQAFGANSSTFLFSVTNDAFIPYRPMVEHPICLKGAPDRIMFGNTDLVLAASFDKCTAVLEDSFSLGLGEEDAKTYLAGSPEFKADIVEVWGFFTNK